MKATVFDSAYRFMDKQMNVQSLYFPMYIQGNFNIEYFKKSVEFTVGQIPELGSIISKGFWRDRWIPIKDFSVEKIIEQTNIESRNFYDSAIKKFFLSDKKKSG